MNLDPAPRQPKLVFLAIDAGLLITAALIVAFAQDPYAPLPFVSAVLCVVLAAIIGLIPFLTDYAADSAEYVQAERGRVTDQVQRLQAAAESLARAGAQIKAVEEAVHKTAHAAENLPYRMQEKLAEFNETLAAKENDEREALERELDELRAANSDTLKGVADKLLKAVAECSAVEAAVRKQTAALTAETGRVQQDLAALTRAKEAAQEAGTKLQAQLQSALAQLDARLAALDRAAQAGPAAPAASIRSERHSEPTPPSPTVHPSAAPADPAPVAVVDTPAPEADPEPAATATPVIETVTLNETPAPAAEEPKPKKPRVPRKPRPEDVLATMSAEPPAPAEEPAPAGEFVPAPAAGDDTLPLVEETPAKTESSASSDGATRLLVTAYIGIGNKLFIRGDGPGLSWDKGVPMQFVSIGKWGWASHDATGPVRCKLYKNDDTPALSGELTIEPGKHVEATALF